MPYKLYNADGIEVSHDDLQDKSLWCEKGISYEETFINKYGAGLNLKINPQKGTDRYAPDLVNKQGMVADLKTQNTPFFQAKLLYSLDPQYAVTFNVNDFNRYKDRYPGIEIFFWVKWVVTRFESNSRSIIVNPMEGVWYIPFDKLIELAKTAPIHRYKQRQEDNKGNARDSYVFDLRAAEFSKLF